MIPQVDLGLLVVEDAAAAEEEQVEALDLGQHLVAGQVAGLHDAVRVLVARGCPRHCG